MILLFETATVITSIIIFLLFNLIVIALLLIAKSKLSPSGPVKILINGQNIVEAEAGSSLLSTLSAQKIFLPSACGGGGTCAMCKCQVLAGGGEILPTEKIYFTRKQQQENWRLGCQVKVKQDLEIRVPDEIFGIRKWECEVVSNDNVATYIKEFVVRLPEGEFLEFVSGSYIQLDVPVIEVDFKTDLYNIDKRFHEDYDKFRIWDLKMKNPEPIFRAYSMANHPAEGNIIMLNIRLATPPWDKKNRPFHECKPRYLLFLCFLTQAGRQGYDLGPLR